MARKVTLPPYDVVIRWNEEKVGKWLKKVQLDDCVPAFEHRHIDGAKLLELTEQKLFSFQDMKIKHRGQISKCVNECKSQASNAKRIVGTIRHRKSKERSVPQIENGDEYDSEDEFDYWDSDFDEDFDDEGSEEIRDHEGSFISEDCTEIKTDESISSESLGDNSNSDHLRAKFIPKPPDVPVVSTAFSPNSQKTVPRSSIPRPPLKRPPSQPPPPPVSQVPSPGERGPLEDYEIPINHQGNTLVPSPSLTLCESALSTSSSLSEISSPPETYEVIEPPEENYEIVESPPLPAKTEKPVLPPRLLATSARPCPPPPLPQKPKKFQEVASVDKVEGYRSLNRPKLPMKQDDEGTSDTSSAGGIGSVILNSFLGRRNSLPSPKLNSRLKDTNSSDGSVSNQVQISSNTCSQSSRSSSPEKEGLFKVGSSAFVTSVTLHPETLKSLPLSSLEQDEIAQNMATRPLPPVPQVQSNNSSVNEQCDVSSFPWFHEIERHDAEEKIRNFNQCGSFLVRPSKRAGKDNPYTLTVLHDGKIFHLNIRQRPDSTFALGKEKIKEKSFPTVPALIKYHQNEPILLTSRGESAGQTILNVYPVK